MVQHGAACHVGVAKKIQEALAPKASKTLQVCRWPSSQRAGRWSHELSRRAKQVHLTWLAVTSHQNSQRLQQIKECIATSLRLTIISSGQQSKKALHHQKKKHLSSAAKHKGVHASKNPEARSCCKNTSDDVRGTHLLNATEYCQIYVRSRYTWCRICICICIW